MNDLETGIFNSGLVLNYLLCNKSSFTIFLEDGAKIAGTLLGWDADFLLIKEGNFLQMVRIKKILRLQAELENIVKINSTVTHENLNSSFSEVTKINSTNNSVNSVAKFKPTLTEVKTLPPNQEAANFDEKNEVKDKLDQLVKNW